MENFKNYAVASIAICAIAMCGTASNILTKQNYVVTAKDQHSDTLSTEQFIRQMSLGSSKEVNLSILAKMRSKNSAVRTYAVKVMDASILANEELRPLAATKNITLADSTTTNGDQMILALAGTKKTGFDQAYLATSLKNHDQLAAMLEKVVMSPDTTVSALATKFLLVWRRNMESARFLSKSIKNGKMVADGPPKEE